MKKRVFLKVCVGLMVVSLSGCGEKEDAVQNNSSVNESQIEESKEEQASSESSEEAVSDDSELESLFWILQQDFSVPQKEFTGTLYNEALVMPLDLTTLDDISAAPYVCLDYGDKQPVNTISEMLSSEERIINPSDSKGIWTQNDTVNRVGQFDEEFCGIIDFNIYNVNETEKLSLKTCYENGWWAIEGSEFDNHKKTLQVSGRYDIDVCDQVIERFGSPTYIADAFNPYESLDAYFSSMKVDSIEMYSMIYEYEDFALVIRISESSFGAEPNVEIKGISYYPSTMWEHIKLEEDFEARFIQVN